MSTPTISTETVTLTFAYAGTHRGLSVQSIINRVCGSNAKTMLSDDPTSPYVATIVDKEGFILDRVLRDS
jgi:hypothetical protein